MKTYLVEIYSSKIEFEKNSKIIALTPEACYQLDEAGIKYSILEDYFGLKKTLIEKEDYFVSQLNWFNKFDDLLFDIFPYARKMKFRLATQYYYFLKTMINSIINRSDILTSFIERTNPENIIYISSKWKPDKINFTLMFEKSESLFSRITPLVCQKYSILFDRIILEKKEVNYTDPLSNIGRLIKNLKILLKKNKFIASIYYYRKVVSISSGFLNLFKHSNLNLFLLKPGYGAEGLIKDAIKEGNKVFVKSNEEILYHSPFGIKKRTKIKINTECAKMEEKFQGKWKDIEGVIKNQSQILDWINGQCKIGVSSIVLPRIKYFIEVICPEILSLIDGFVEFYDNNHIDFVITPHQSEVEDYAAISATKYGNSAKSVCIQHGNDVFDTTARDFLELKPYDIYLTTDEEFAEALNRVNLHLDCKTIIIHSFSHRLNKFVSISRRRKKRRRTVIYLPTFFTQNINIVRPGCYKGVWYYEWQKSLLGYFATRKDFDFIWKALPFSHGIYNPIPNLIKGKKYQNIKYTTTHFYYWIKHADLVFLDYPSTALYEAAVSKIPVMTLYNTNSSKVRDGAKNIFRKSLQPFSTISEGIEKVEEFLNSNPDDFIVSLTLSNIPILDILKEIKLGNVS